MLDELKKARAIVQANKTGWVQIKPEWFATNDDFIAYIVERTVKRRLAILDARIAEIESSHG